MKKVAEMTAKEKAKLLTAISKVQLSNKKIGAYANIDRQAERVISLILESIT